ncbi:MAG TPA: sugar ABC transporter ATP-binding protein, partial [Actinomycetota bacterium]|nr:sugar ABC transporter ATP-binding protein [Actinomycetota bacterium]
SHNLNDVFEVADRIAVLYLGRMVAQGPASEFDRQRVVHLMTTGTGDQRGNGAPLPVPATPPGATPPPAAPGNQSDLGQEG